MTLSSKIGAAPGLSIICVWYWALRFLPLPMLILIPSTKEKKVCDQAVTALFTTPDAIELQRAMFLIRRLDCKISTRL